ncbi:MAG: phosphatase PAP2 family protein [Bauldia sp.]|nr:phosphatase PAP2 family protein [Bauldia sp.]
MTILAAALVVAIADPALAQADLSPPPGPGTTADAVDRAGVAVAFDADRLAQANRDRVLDPFLAFNVVLGDGFADDTLPATERVLDAVQAAVSRAIAEAKGVFPRTRPYAVDAYLRRCGGTLFLAAQRSYPSGHAAIGQAWAIVLAALLPERGAELRARGADYGLSRIACGFHWPSDVAAGQAIGAAIAAQLLTDPAYDRLLRRAAAELAAFG